MQHVVSDFLSYSYPVSSTIGMNVAATTVTATAVAANIQLQNVAQSTGPVQTQPTSQSPNPLTTSNPAATGQTQSIAHKKALTSRPGLLSNIFDLSLWPKFGSVTTWIFTTVAFVFGILLLSYAIWTGKKDFHQFCLTLNV
jgi:hypothetical protein